MQHAQSSSPSPSLVTGPRTPELWNYTMGELITMQAAQFGNHTATIFSWQRQRLSYQDLAQRSEEVARSMLAGVFLPQQFRVFHKGGQIFRDLAVRTQNGQSSCAVVFGSSTAGGAYHPALSDYTIFVENQAQVFLAGPPLVKMATGEAIGAEELGGARVHGSITGLADHVAVDEFDAIRKTREWVALLRPPRSRITQALHPVLAPRYPIEDIFALVNPDIRKPFDMKEVVLRLVDDSRLAIFKPEFGRSLLTGWARIMGMSCQVYAKLGY